MWKFVTRGIRETLERRASCRTNVYSQTSPDSGSSTQNEVKTNIPKNQKFLVPSVTTCNSGFCGSTKTDGPNDKKYDSKWDTKRSWSEAVGWSSVLAIGWVVCQSLCLRRRLFERSKEEKWHCRLLRFKEAHVPLSFIDVFNLNPRHVLPVTNCVANSTIKESNENLKEEWTAQRPYGPITIEEALKEAKDDYTKTHRLVMGEFELRFGVKAMEENRYKDAVKHFSTGASLSSSGSMFNLGLCHELGIGTVTDTTKAAKYYRDAAEKGHPDAMYNLGVFHAQGRGGLALDIGKARELFTEAANLGQTQARIALDLEKNLSVFRENESVSDRVIPDYSSSNKVQTKGNSKKVLRVGEYQESIINNMSRNSVSKGSYYDENIEDDTNPTENFLNSLGIQQNPVPILLGTGVSNLPYYS